jgi:hypothetical protein
VFGVGFSIWGSEEQHREDLSMAKLISGHPDIPYFLLLNDPANELLLPVGLGADRILTPIGGPSKASWRATR